MTMQNPSSRLLFIVASFAIVLSVYGQLNIVEKVVEKAAENAASEACGKVECKLNSDSKCILWVFVPWVFCSFSFGEIRQGQMLCGRSPDEMLLWFDDDKHSHGCHSGGRHWPGHPYCHLLLLLQDERWKTGLPQSGPLTGVTLPHMTSVFDISI